MALPRDLMSHLARKYPLKKESLSQKHQGWEHIAHLHAVYMCEMTHDPHTGIERPADMEEITGSVSHLAVPVTNARQIATTLL
jgi:hypothetical protein